MATIVSPSILSANFGNLNADIELLNSSDATWIHVDVMDGVFVPNISFGFPIIKSVQAIAKKPLDVHLMIANPDAYLENFKALGASIITIHYEGAVHLHRSICRIKELGCLAGVAINPHTPVSVLSEILPDLDLVLMMSVNPGFGGQKFIEHTFRKVIELKTLIELRNPTCLIEIDGGVDLSNAAKLVAAGANALVAGNAIFGAENPKDVISKLNKLNFL